MCNESIFTKSHHKIPHSKPAFQNLNSKPKVREDQRLAPTDETAGPRSRSGDSIDPQKPETPYLRIGSSDPG